MTRTILDRALNGRDLVASAYGAQGYVLGLEEYEDALVDALTNLMHFARRYDIDFDEELQRAKQHYSVEARLDWDATP